MLVVKKFGGSSLKSEEAICKVAELIKNFIFAHKGTKLIIVVSAMAGTTEKLIKQVGACAKLPDLSEYDAVVSSGEQIASGLLAIALQRVGINARSAQGWQVGLKTFGLHTESNYFEDSSSNFIKEMLKKHDVVVVPGFQGVDHVTNRITTVGRNGSDVTALLLSSMLALKKCYIYTDVPGIFTGDPNIVKDARLVDKLSFKDAVFMANMGAKVIDNKAILMAEKNAIDICVLSTSNVDKHTNGHTLITEDVGSKSLKVVIAKNSCALVKNIFLADKSHLSNYIARGFKVIHSDKTQTILHSTCNIKARCAEEIEFNCSLITIVGLDIIRVKIVITDLAINYLFCKDDNGVISILVDSIYSELLQRVFHACLIQEKNSSALKAL